MTNPSPTGSKILIVDDEKEVCATLKEFLELEEDGFRVKVAHDGEDALAVLEKFDFDCVLLDVRMPKMTGVEALKKIKAVRPNAQIVMVTAIDNIKLAEECMRSGAFGFIPKPVDLDYLLREIKAALEHKVESAEKEKAGREEKDRLRDQAEALGQKAYEALKLPIDFMGFLDPGFGVHSRNAAWLAREMGRELEYPNLRILELAGLYHDIGKMCLPGKLRTVSFKDLNDAEKRVYQQFPVYGQEIVNANLQIEGLGQALRQQCEKTDGSGFPDGLRAGEICLEARILAVANHFDETMARAGFRNIEVDIVEGRKFFQFSRDLEKRFDVAVVEALFRVVDSHKYKSAKEVEMPVDGLKPKMILSRDLFTRSGCLAFNRETVLSPERILRILDFHRIDPLPGKVFVYSVSVGKNQGSP